VNPSRKPFFSDRLCLALTMKVQARGRRSRERSRRPHDFRPYDAALCFARGGVT
jgi:hypothetical protein